MGHKFKDQYNELYHPDDKCIAARLYDLPRIHKVNMPFRAIVSACDTPTYRLACNQNLSTLQWEQLLICQGS